MVRGVGVGYTERIGVVEFRGEVIKVLVGGDFNESGAFWGRGQG